MKRAFPILTVLTTLFVAYGFYLGLFVAPTERTMGNVQRIFYFHAPSGWTAFWLFFVNFIASVQYLANTKPSTQRAAKWTVIAIGIVGAIVPFIPQVREQLPTGMYPSSVATTMLLLPVVYFLIGKYFPGQSLDALAVAAAEVGVVFCTVVLVTGPLWARPVWGIWWTWDLRLTSTLVLWLIYVSYLMLRRLTDNAQTPVLAAVLAVFGALDVPLVYFSIWFFRTQHPQPVIGGGGSLDPNMRTAFWTNVAAFSCYGALVCWARYRVELMHREVEEAHAVESLLDVGSGPGIGTKQAHRESMQ
jgi:heme exporter protein C